MPTLLSTGAPGPGRRAGRRLTPNRLYLLEGAPGAGKTTWRCSSCWKARARGEPVLYVTLSETAEELQGVAQSHGWDLTASTSASCCRRRDA